ncbi:MAG: hypothetical protein FRX49_11956 [Trebouxia sp. A1-2]|nr:MAG: hypothetical protein FRX49_11956 [Trebouxia sp. A1-2]
MEDPTRSRAQPPSKVATTAVTMVTPPKIQHSKHRTDLDQEGHSPAHAGPYHTPKDVPHSNADGWEQVAVYLNACLGLCIPIHTITGYNTPVKKD